MKRPVIFITILAVLAWVLVIFTVCEAVSLYIGEPVELK